MVLDYVRTVWVKAKAAAELPHSIQVNAGLCVFCFPHRFNHAGKFDDFALARAVRPIVLPTNDDVTAVNGMAVVAEIAALKFKFDGDALPAAGSDQAHGFAIGESRLHVFDQVA